jgi:hypothetical protein
MIETLTIFLSKNILTILWISALSTLGATAGYIKKIKSGTIERFRISELVGEIVISFFLGVVTYFLCKGSGINEFLTVGFVCVVSHLGTKGLTMIEQVIPKVVCKYLNINCEDSK